MTRATLHQLQSLPKEDRPRERLQSKGPKALEDYELMAVILGRGTKKLDVLALAKQIVGNLHVASEHEVTELQDHHGIGEAQTLRIVAAIELGRRIARRKTAKIYSPKDILPLVGHLSTKTQEHLIVVALDGSYEVLSNRIISIGSANRVEVHPREVFAEAISDRAAAVVLAHNHPSKSLEPSKEDIAATQRVLKAGKILGIALLDHIIFSNGEYFSFRETWGGDLGPHKIKSK